MTTDVVFLKIALRAVVPHLRTSGCYIGGLKCPRAIVYGLSLIIATLCLLPFVSEAQTYPRLNDLWSGKAHFEQVGTVEWPNSAGLHGESASWFITRNGTWFAFSRAYLDKKYDYCPIDNTRIVVRQSTDQGKSWSKPITAVNPGDSPGADDCAALDGSTYFDKPTGTWHILSQCLPARDSSHWALCHYTRKAASPVGRFMPDRANPVVKGGSLWSKICAGPNKSCPVTTQDEGTPEILGKHLGHYIVTMHGWDPQSGHGYRGVVATTDFHTWATQGDTLPGDAIFGAKDCASWLAGCVGTGANSTLLDAKYTYVLGEVMDKSLACQTQQTWVFELFRKAIGPWPRSGSGGWEKLPGEPLLVPTWRDADSPCQLAYAKWIVDRKRIYIIYEDWAPNRKFVARRLLELQFGGGKRVRTK